MWDFKLLNAITIASMICLPPAAALAETKPSSATNNTAITAPVAAAAPSSSGKVDLLRRFFVASEFDQLFTTTMNSMIPSLMDDYHKQNPDLTESDLKYFKEAVEQTIIELKPKMINVLSNSLGDIFTEVELAKIVEFYESPAGQSMSRKAPILLKKMEEALNTLGPELAAGFNARFCKKVECEE